MVFPISLQVVDDWLQKASKLSLDAGDRVAISRLLDYREALLEASSCYLKASKGY